MLDQTRLAHDWIGQPTGFFEKNLKPGVAQPVERTLKD